MGRALATYRKLFDDVKKGKLRRLYFLYGPEEYLKKEFVRELVERALPGANRAFNLDIVYGDEFDRALFDDRIHSFPLFTERRVVILKRFGDLSLAHKDHVIAGAEDLPESLILVIETPEEKLANARLKALAKLAQRTGLAAPFAFLDERETVERLLGRLRREGVEIEPEALDLLVESVGTQLIDLSNEVDKILLAAGERRTIDRELVRDVVGHYRTENLFAFLDGLGGGDVAGLVRRLSGLIDGGEEPIMVLAMLLKRVVLLMEVKALVAESGGGGGRALASTMQGTQSPYYAEILSQQARRFTMEDLERLLANLRWAETKAKSTALAAKGLVEEALLASHLGKALASPTP